MYNTQLPSRAELPSTGKLLRSTIIALISAAIILITIVLPSEYAIDPTGIGARLGLTQMGEIKTQLAAEAEADAKAQAQTAAPTVVTAEVPPVVPPETAPEPMEPVVKNQPNIQPNTEPRVEPSVKTKAEAETAVAVTLPQSAEPAAPSGKTDEVSFTLKPGQGAEIKLVMKAGARANYSWTANGAIVNYDTHGDGGGRSISYEKGRGVPTDEGVLEAAFDGSHGWFWRNRTKSDVTVTVKTSGDYSELKRFM